ncbi:flagellar hook-associated protein 3 [Coprothermobacteraceae bacterium]|nr:flagellar hook-associated protein 3 [Coprothermobacteraceae bacterium]
MRITDSYMYERGMQTLQTVLGRLANLQDNLSTGKRILRPSDNPLDSSLVLHWKSYAVQVERWQKNIEELKNRFSFAEQSLLNAKDILLSVRDVVVRAGSDALGPDEKGAMASQMLQLADELLNTLNAKYAGRFVFANAEVDRPGEPQWKPFKAAVQYADGTVKVMDTITAADAEVNRNPGSRWLVLFEPRTFEELGDPQQGTAAVEIGINSTMPQVLAVEGFLRFSGEVEVNGVKHKSTLMFDKMFGFVAALRRNESLATADDSSMTPLDYTDDMIDGITGAVSALGARVQRLELVNRFYQNVGTSVEALRSSYEDADMARTYVDYTKFNTGYQALLKVIASISSRTLVDYL